jgi:predicted enzyme related to lactoylglutathione lyase
VADLGAKLGEVEKLGGKTIVPPSEVPGKGRYAVITDPSGAALGLWEVLKR